MAQTRRGMPDSNLLHAIAYGGLALVGVIAIVALKLIGLPQIVVTAAPVAIMIAYASLAAFPQYRVRSDQIGDNLYYLGFVFTLASLSTSLVQFDASGDVEKISSDVQKIIGNFGVALLTTLIGVILRVAFNQLRTDPIETEREARLQLAEAARQLRRELTEATSEFSMATRVVRQSVADGVAEMQEQLADTLKGASELLRQSMVDASEKMTTTSEELRSAIHSSSEKLTGASGRLSDSIDATTTSISVSRTAMTSDQKAFDDASRALVASVEELIKRLDAAVAPGDPIRKALDETTASLAALDAVTVKVGNNLSDAASKSVEIVASSHSVSAEAVATARTAREQAAGIIEAARLVAGASAAIDAAELQPERIRKSLDDLATDLAKSSQRIASELGAALSPGIAVSQQAAHLEALVARLDALISLMNDQARSRADTERDLA